MSWCLPEISKNLLTVPLPRYILTKEFEIMAMIMIPRYSQIIFKITVVEKKIKQKLFIGQPVHLKTAAVLQQKAFCHIVPME